MLWRSVCVDGCGELLAMETLINQPLPLPCKQERQDLSALSKKHTWERESISWLWLSLAPTYAKERERVAPHQKCASKRIPPCHMSPFHAWGCLTLATEWVKLTKVAHVAQFILTWLPNVLVKLREASVNCRHGDPLCQVSVLELSQACRLKITELC